MAEEMLESRAQDSYNYHITFSEDGWSEHTYVERLNVSRYGIIDIKYTMDTNTMEVTCSNIEVLKLDCRSLFEDKAQDIFGVSSEDGSNYYKWYFIEKDHLNVNIDTDEIITNLTFIDIPIPYEVRVNGEKWLEDDNYYFQSAYGVIISDVPEGHSNVDIYFKSPETQVPIAKLYTDKDTIFLGEHVFLSGSESYDPDGGQLQLFWDLGDGTFIVDKSTLQHEYKSEGIFGVILTVRDAEQLIAHAYLNITVLNGSQPTIRGIIPDQVHDEDSLPWELDLSLYEPAGNFTNREFKWYITGEDQDLFTLKGENSTNDILIFTPVKNAFGSNKVDIWVTDNENILLHQDLWINLTPLNDPPIITGSPDLVLQFDMDYTFNYEPYILDVDTPRDKLELTTSDDTHTHINGFNVTYRYPEEYIDKENTYVILTIDDGDDSSQDLIEIKVIDGIMPVLLHNLPDITLYEGETRYNLFNLDYYFSPVNDDWTFQVVNQKNINVIIHENLSVTFKAPHDWVGKEFITFRASKSSGALLEDSIIVTILPKNDPPIISAIPDIVVHYEQDYIFDLRPYIFDEDNDVSSLQFSTSEPECININTDEPYKLIINYPWQSTLPYDDIVILSVSDGLSLTEQEFTIIITSNHPPRLLKSLPEITFYEDTILNNAFNIFNYFIDIDGDELSYNISAEIINGQITQNGTVKLSAPANWFGEEDITVTVWDDARISGFYQTYFSVYVIPVNDGPVLDKIPSVNINVSETVRLNLIPYIHDVDNELYELKLALNKTNLKAELFSFDLVIYGNTSQTDKLELELTDGEKTTKEIILVSIQNKNNGNAVSENSFWIVPVLLILLLVSTGLFFLKRYYGKYKVVETFLIYQNGCLINHSTIESNSRDSNEVDVVGSMFTAVQDFVEDSFANGDTDNKKWALKRMECGENNIYIERGEHIYLAVIFTGSAGNRLYKNTRVIINNIEDQYKPILKKWNGDLDKFDKLSYELK